jgi:hypothetical protein
LAVLEYRVKSSDTIARPESPGPVEFSGALVGGDELTVVTGAVAGGGAVTGGGAVVTLVGEVAVVGAEARGTAEVDPDEVVAVVVVTGAVATGVAVTVVGATDVLALSCEPAAVGSISGCDAVVSEPAPTVTTLDAVWSPESALIVAWPFFLPVTTPVADTVATVVSLDFHVARPSATPLTGCPSGSTNAVASFMELPTAIVGEVGAICTDDGAGNAYLAAVRSVISDPFLFASVPAHAAMAKTSAVSTVLVLKFTV